MTRRLIDRHDPAPYVPAANTDIRATFARFREDTNMIDDRHRRYELRQSNTLRASSQHLADLGRDVSSLRLVTQPATLDAAFRAPPPRRMSDSELRRAVDEFAGQRSTALRIPRTGPARIADRTRAERVAMRLGMVGVVVAAVAAVVWGVL